MPKNLVRMNAVPINAAFCKQFIVIASGSLITAGITEALTFHSLFTCNLKSL